MRRSEIPSLDDLRAFEVVARLGSVRAAANEIALTHGAVSRRITKLADTIGVQLFEPDGRGIRLTADGQKLAQAVTDSFRLLSTALSEIRTAPKEQPIVLSCERSVAMRWLIPRLSAFQDTHPEADLHLSVGGGGLDFQRDRATLAIRRLDFPIDPDWTVQILMNESVGPVMQPEMVDRFLTGDYIALGANTRPEAWQEWLDEHHDAPQAREIRFLDHHFLMAESAASGLGVALCPKALAIDDLKRGRLIAPFGFSEDGTQYGLIHPRDMQVSEQIALLKDWLAEISGEIDGSGAGE